MYSWPNTLPNYRLHTPQESHFECVCSTTTHDEFQKNHYFLIRWPGYQWWGNQSRSRRRAQAWWVRIWVLAFVVV